MNILEICQSFQKVDLIWVIPILLFIHELEEWNILEWYKKYYKNLPKSTNHSIHIHIFTLGILGFMLTLIAYILQETFWFSLIFVFLSAFSITNTIQHIIWTFQYKSYSPGLITGIILMTTVILINCVFLHNNLIIPFFYILILLIISPIIKTLKSKHEMTSDVRRIHNFFIEVSKVLRRKIRKK